MAMATRSETIKAIQDDLEETHVVMCRSVCTLLKRGETLHTIEKQANDLNYRARELRIGTSRCPSLARLVENTEDWLQWMDDRIRAWVEGNGV